MACDHKFLADLWLERVDFEPTTLIAGTFDPSWPEENNAPWFYGRTAESCFWDVLPRLCGGDSLINAGAGEWKQFCRDNRIALTDLISSIDDADPANRSHRRMLGGYSDKAIVYNFDDFEYVDIPQLLQRHTTIRNVYLTRGVTEAFWKHAWNPVAYYCNRHGLHERKLITPSAEAQYHFDAYNREHPDRAIAALEDYILQRWRQEWHSGE